jgi:peroxiredoxin
LPLLNSISFTETNINLATYNHFAFMALKLLIILVAMVKKLIFLIGVLFLLPNLPAYGQGGTLFSKIGIRSIGDKKKAPDFCLAALNGEKVPLKTFKGKIIFLNFWASWCGPCKEEMPSMETLYQQYKGRDFIFLTISLDYGGTELVKKFIEKHGYHFPVLLDPQGRTLDLFEINKLPATIIIDKNGKMIGRAIGSRNWSSPEVFSLIDQMLNDSSGKVLSLKD